ncbi:MAG: hypothetical protein HFJ50_05830 [Clostridia bacterium]|jgi:chemotaxis response regulator CheB|nr:hypothetical protein [Clostridia bacterium]
MEKIRVLIAHSDEKIKEEVLNSIESLDYAEVVGTAETGEDTYTKIINLKPDVVFAKYDFEKLDGLQIIEKAEDELKQNIPTFNLIIQDKEVSEERVVETLKKVGTKLNTFVRMPFGKRALDVLEKQKEEK